MSHWPKSQGQVQIQVVGGAADNLRPFSVIFPSEDNKFIVLNNLLIITTEPMQPLIFGCFYSNETKINEFGMSFPSLSFCVLTWE